MELAECRAYELVSPPYTQGNPPQGLGGLQMVVFNESHGIASSYGTVAGSPNWLAIIGGTYEPHAYAAGVDERRDLAADDSVPRRITRRRDPRFQ